MPKKPTSLDTDIDSDILDNIPKSKKEVESKEGAARDNITLRCGDCLHYANSINPVYGELCRNRGVRTFAVAPTCYTPDTNALRNMGPETFAALLSVLSSITPRQTRVLMGLMRNAGRLEKFGFSFLEKIYFLAGEDYLQNYSSARVLGVGINSTIMVVADSFMKSPRKPFVAALMAGSVLNAEKFVKVRTSLIQQGRLYEPRSERKTIAIDDSYVPPTIEMSEDQVENLASANPKRRGTTKILEIKIKT